MLTTKQLNCFKTDPNQPRKPFDEAELDRLGADMLVPCVLVDLLIRGDRTIIDGEGRWRAAWKEGGKYAR